MMGRLLFVEMLYNAYEVLKQSEKAGKNYKGKVEMLYNAYEVLKRKRRPKIIGITSSVEMLYNAYEVLKQFRGMTQQAWLS